MKFLPGCNKNCKSQWFLKYFVSSVIVLMKINLICLVATHLSKHMFFSAN